MYLFSASLSGIDMQILSALVSQGVCWPDLLDIGSLAKRAQESTYNLAQSAIAEHAANELHIID